MKDASSLAPRILVVEDDENLRALLVKLVRRSGYQAVPAHSGEQALAILRDPAQPVDWLLTDIRLGSAIDGWAVASEFRLANPLRPIIFMSGVEEDSRARPATNSIFLRKPVDVDEVVNLFHSLAGTEHPAKRIIDDIDDDRR